MYHEPFPNIENNENIYGGREMLPYQVARLIYEKLCTVADLLEGKPEPVPVTEGLKDALKKLKSDNSGTDVVKPRRTRTRKVKEPKQEVDAVTTNEINSETAEDEK